LLQVENKLSLHSLYKRGEIEWEFSSAGSEHLPYKQRVGGSNPSTPTSSLEFIRGFFVSKGQGFSHNSTGLTSTACLEGIRYFFALIFLSFMCCSFYILFSASRNAFYVGHTCDDLSERLRKHNSNHKGFIGVNVDWEVVYFESFPDKSTAYKREREVNSWKSRKKLMELIVRKV
jgi:putative endonuclease